MTFNNITPPSTWLGSNPEYMIWWALTKLGIAFDFQSARLGGRLERGGVVLDFHIPDRSLGINVQSGYYHYRLIEARLNDRLQREILESMGIRIIYIDEEDALRAPLFYTKQALMGIDHSLMAR